jgi:hypothetical protein
MKLSDKIKTALEEVRILILGAQILLGFQFRGAFSEVTSGFRAIPVTSPGWHSGLWSAPSDC